MPALRGRYACPRTTDTVKLEVSTRAEDPEHDEREHAARQQKEHAER